jgi:CRISPR-associated protein Csb2
LALSEPPSFQLPHASAAHTRHYLSLNQIERTKTTLTLDTFVTVNSDAPVIFTWDLDLGPRGREILSHLFSRLTYLGRAESWCEVRVLAEDEQVLEPNCVPSDGSAVAGVETVRTLCAASSAEIGDLERTTSALQDEGWSEPPGSRWVFYRRKAGLLGNRFRAAVPTLTRPPVSVAEFTVAGLLRTESPDEDSGRSQVSPVCPRVTKAVLLTSSLRGAALKRHAVPSSVLSGKAADGTPLLNQHRHAHYLFDSRADGDSQRQGKVTHLYVWVPDHGLGEQEQEALERIQKLYYYDGAERQELRVVPSGVGNVEDFGFASRVFGKSRVWESLSPVLLPRHPKRGGRDLPEDQIRRELAFRRFAEPVAVDEMKTASWLGSEIHWAVFETRRKGIRPQTATMGFRIEFAEPLRGPISLGLGGHFGLGQFGAVS